MAPSKKPRKMPASSKAKQATLQRHIPGIAEADYTLGINEYVDELAPRTALEIDIAADLAAVTVEHDQLRARKHMLM